MKLPKEVTDVAPRGACYLCKSFYHMAGSKGQCRKSAPANIGFPSTNIDVWCGEFEWDKTDPRLLTPLLKDLCAKNGRVKAAVEAAGIQPETVGFQCLEFRDKIAEHAGAKTMALIDEVLKSVKPRVK